MFDYNGANGGFRVYITFGVLTLVLIGPGGTARFDQVGLAGAGANAGEWHHYSLTFRNDIATGVQKCLVDGIEATLNPQFNNHIATTTFSDNILHIGQYSDGTAHFKGRIDDVRLYDVAVGGFRVNEVMADPQ